jgi:REP element-mobilizing transposase RayT
MWNNTDIPLAYLITFRCYGTWLHGDERGSIDRNNNQYQTPYLPANKALEELNRSSLKSNPVSLDTLQRTLVESAIRDVCEHRKWTLFSINVRTNHIHTVVAIGEKSPHRALNDFKSYATRNLRAKGGWNFEHSPWSDRGSERYLWNERSIEIAVDYVINGQGDELPKFE